MIENALLTLHIVSVIAWMAGIFYLPRLFVYHTRLSTTESSYAMFLVMEGKLLQVIMGPAAIATWSFGLSVAVIKYGWIYWPIWLWLKAMLVVGMTIFHLACIRWRRLFLNAVEKNGPASGNRRSEERFYRIVNEVPTLLLLGVVALVVFQPVL